MRRRFALIIILICTLIGPVCGAIPRSSSNPDDFVSSRMQHFWVDGRPFRFVGYNLRGLAHYGADYFWDNDESSREANLDYMEGVGAKVARVFMSYRFANNNTALGDNLDAALQVAAQHNVRLIVVFTDEYYSNFCPIGDGAYYGYQGNGIMGQSFFSGGYLTNYVPLVNYIVNRFKNDPTVFAWQLGNELKTPWNPADILNFSHDMASRIKAVDPNHMVSHGTAGRNFSGLTTAQATQLYQDFDFLTIHPYNGDENLNDSSLANTLRKPLLVSEAGFDGDNPDRPTLTDADIAKWVSRGARGYMNWGLMIVDNGDGDHIFGIDQADHIDDFDGYTDVYTRWAQTLAYTPMPAPDAPTGLNASDAKWGDRVEITWNSTFAADEYAVYRAASPVATKVQISSWQSGTSFIDVSVSRAVTYYYYVKARNEGGESAYSSVNAGYTNNAPHVTIQQAKSQQYMTIYITNCTVSAAFAGEFYIQQQTGLPGIAVVWNGTVTEGSRVDILGTLATTPAGERKITATSVLVLP